MPIYEFVCAPCEERFEKLTSISRVSETTCPKCGSGEVKRVMSMFAARVSGGSSHSCGCDSSCTGGNCSSCHCH